MSQPNDTPTESASKALALVQDGQIVGLGSGRAATAFVHALGERVRAGLDVRCVPTSEATASLATRLGIPLTALDASVMIDLTVDGADEVDPDLNLIKGLGGALVREKIVAAASKRLVICVGADKQVEALGSHGVLPVEVVPFALGYVSHQLQEMGLPAQPRQKDGSQFVSDNGNPVLDCRVGPIADPRVLEARLLAIPGVVGTGLFLGMAHTVIVQDGQTIGVRSRDD